MGPPEHAGGEGGRPSGRVGAAVVDHLAPTERAPGRATTATASAARSGRRSGEQATDVGVGTEQHHEGAPSARECSAISASVDRSGVHDGQLPRRGRGRRRPVGTARAHPCGPRASTVTRGSRGSTVRPPRAGSAGAATRARHGDGLEGEVGAEDRGDPGGEGGPGEPHRATDAVAVGEAEDAQPLVGGDGRPAAPGLEAPCRSDQPEATCRCGKESRDTRSRTRDADG